VRQETKREREQKREDDDVAFLSIRGRWLPYGVSDLPIWRESILTHRMVRSERCEGASG
jgi:hypothetical protein